MAMIEGSVKDMLAKVSALVRSKPADPSARMQLFRLLCVTGQWDRAETQLDVAAGLDASLALTVLAHRHALNCERFRHQVFAGKRAPLFLGEPDQGAAMLAQAITSLRALCRSKASRLHHRAQQEDSGLSYKPPMGDGETKQSAFICRAAAQA